jgi:hypothetical protein
MVNSLHQVWSPQATAFLDPALELLMPQRSNLLKALFGLNLSPQQAQALLEKVNASNLSSADRDLLSHIIRDTVAVTEAPLPPDVGVAERPATRGASKRRRPPGKASGGGKRR